MIAPSKVTLKKDIELCEQCQNQIAGSEKIYSSLIAKYSTFYPSFGEEIPTTGKARIHGGSFDYRDEVFSIKTKLEGILVTAYFMNENKIENAIENASISEIFISYSWVNDEPNENVLYLVAALREKGYNAVCDVILSQRETAINFNKMMAESLKKADKVIIVLSEEYKRKADSFIGGVGDEYQYIVEDIKNKPQKYILVAFENDRNKVTPDFLRGRDLLLLARVSQLAQRTGAHPLQRNAFREVIMYIQNHQLRYFSKPYFSS
jgi:hypothetical protein